MCKLTIYFLENDDLYASICREIKLYIPLRLSDYYYLIHNFLSRTII